MPILSRIIFLPVNPQWKFVMQQSCEHVSSTKGFFMNSRSSHGKS
jgi:hypothetical protein